MREIALRWCFIILITILGVFGMSHAIFFGITEGIYAYFGTWACVSPFMFTIIIFYLVGLQKLSEQSIVDEGVE